jgi:hypothetical protein
MKNKTNPPLSEKDLDRLLGQSFLNLDSTKPENNAVIESIANYSLGRASFLTNLTIKSTMAKLLIALFALGLTTASIYYQQPIRSAQTPGIQNVLPIVTKQTDTILTVEQAVLVDRNNKAGKPFVDKTLLLKDSVLVPAEAEMPEVKESLQVIQAPANTTGQSESDYVFPVLTEKEIRANEKQKKKMSKLVARLAKEKYAPIPGKNMYMQTTEVTNIEYRTFLFDLLIQGKKSEFLLAKPEQSVWANCNGTHKFDKFEWCYFSDKRFNEYPVVAIPSAGAELYCRWLSDLVSSLPAKDNKAFGYVIALPTESEWRDAAHGGFEASYPWNSDSIQNNKNCFLGNFCIQKEKDQFRQPWNYFNKTNANAFTAAGMATNTDTMATANVLSYNPNAYALYCMSGNVSEMVYSADGASIKALGGNWASSFRFLKIAAEEEFKGPLKPSAMIGFRVRIKQEK